MSLNLEHKNHQNYLSIIIIILTFVGSFHLIEAQSITQINTGSNEINPFFSNTEEHLFFSCDKKGNFDIYGVDFHNNTVTSVPKLINQFDEFDRLNVNSPSDETSGCISLNGKKIFISSNDKSDGFGKSDIYFSKISRGDWLDIKNLNQPFNSSSFEGNPTLTPDGRTMYFCSDRPGGYGGFDIWFSKYDEFSEQWKEPQNLEIVNTDGDETSPFLAPDGKTLFFASDSMMYCLGKKDFYYIQKEKDEWSKIKHLDAPINSEFDEKSLIFTKDGTKAIISSDRNGNFDLFMYEIEKFFETPITIQLQATEESTKNLLPVIFSVYNGNEKLFVKKGENVSVNIMPDKFEKNEYMDLTIKATNPIYPEHSKIIRIYKDQKESTLKVDFLISDNPRN